ncbi:hypothetical protein FACS189430_11910 [Bacteroidia bacterium]|nr:hypothetical protein FACS189430_11910 [Bacteroidia bacterium]
MFGCRTANNRHNISDEIHLDFIEKCQIKNSQWDSMFCFIEDSKTEEKIINYDVLYELQEDSSAIVTETISIYVADSMIKNGFLREFSYLPRNVKYKILSVKRNNNEESYVVLTANNDNDFFANDDVYAVQINNKNDLKKGIHIFELKYNIVGAISSHSQNTLFIDFVGTETKLKIEKVIGKITLPKQYQVIRVSVGYYDEEEETFLNDDLLSIVNKRDNLNIKLPISSIDTDGTISFQTYSVIPTETLNQGTYAILYW